MLAEDENMDWEKENIDLTQEAQIQRWCKHFNCEPEDLHFAVSVIGNCAKLVNEILELNRRKGNGD
jgi:hypothetical protein